MAMGRIANGPSGGLSTGERVAVLRGARGLSYLALYDGRMGRPSGACRISRLRMLALPDGVERWSLSTLREKVVKIGAKVIAHARYTVFQMAEVAVSRDLFRRILDLVDDLRLRQVARC